MKLVLAKLVILFYHRQLVSDIWLPWCNIGFLITLLSLFRCVRSNLINEACEHIKPAYITTMRNHGYFEWLKEIAHVFEVKKSMACEL